MQRQEQFWQVDQTLLKAFEMCLEIREGADGVSLAQWEAMNECIDSIQKLRIMIREVIATAGTGLKGSIT